MTFTIATQPLVIAAVTALIVGFFLSVGWHLGTLLVAKLSR